MLNLQAQRIFLGATFHLRRERLPVDRALDSHVVDTRLASNRIVFAIDFDDGSAMAPHRIVDFHLGVVVVPLCVKCDDGVGLTDLHVIAR